MWSRTRIAPGGRFWSRTYGNGSVELEVGLDSNQGELCRPSSTHGYFAARRVPSQEFDSEAANLGTCPPPRVSAATSPLYDRISTRIDRRSLGCSPAREKVSQQHLAASQSRSRSRSQSRTAMRTVTGAAGGLGGLRAPTAMPWPWLLRRRQRQRQRQRRRRKLQWS